MIANNTHEMDLAKERLKKAQKEFNDARAVDEYLVKKQNILCETRGDMEAARFPLSKIKPVTERLWHLYGEVEAAFYVSRAALSNLIKVEREMWIILESIERDTSNEPNDEADCRNP